MALLILKKNKSSIKAKTLPDKPSQGDDSGLPSHNLKSPISGPFIDKISVVLDILNEQAAHDTYSSLMESQDDPDWFVGAGSGSKWGKFKWAKRVVIPHLLDQSKYPLLQCAYSAKAVSQYRIELVPVDLGLEGMEALHAVLSAFLVNGWGTFVKNGRVTRIDVAVDLPMQLVDSFHLLNAQGATSKQWGVNGKLTGYAHGKPTGNQTVVYSRKEKRIAQGKSWKGKEGARIERRIRNPATLLAKLNELPNPFEPMKLVGMPLDPPEAQEKSLYVWDLFRRAADAQGLMAALALLPEEKRTLYRKHLAAHTKSWWDPKAIWAEWHTMLGELKIASVDAWK